MIFRFVVLGFFGVFVLPSCSTISKKTCAGYNWENRGYLSALGGDHSDTGYAYYYKHCGEEHGIMPSEPQFTKGFERGIKIFCTPGFAEKFANSGGEYMGTCSERGEEAFLKPYVKGINQYYKREFNNLKNENWQLEHDKSNLQREVDELKRKVEDLENRIRLQH